MKLAWATDTHLNFVKAHQVRNLGRDLARYDHALITGDISDFKHIRDNLNVLASYNKKIHIVAGNHDSYSGSISALRILLTRYNTGQSKVIRYLHTLDVEMLTPKTALIGVDGWYDGRNGDYQNSSVQLNDFYLIKELVGTSRASQHDENVS